MRGQIYKDIDFDFYATFCGMRTFVDTIRLSGTKTKIKQAVVEHGRMLRAFLKETHQPGRLTRVSNHRDFQNI